MGVDVERIQALDDLEQVAVIAFSRSERVALSTLVREQQLLGFYNCWTRKEKEAYVKARGDGLMMPLDAFDVSLTPDEPVALLANRLDPQEIGRWSPFGFSPIEGYIGALARTGYAALSTTMGFADDVISRHNDAFEVAEDGPPFRLFAARVECLPQFLSESLPSHALVANLRLGIGVQLPEVWESREAGLVYSGLLEGACQTGKEY